MSPYGDLRARLVARCHDQENDRGCWLGADGWRPAYQQLDIWVPGLLDPARASKTRARRKVYAHVALWCWDKWGCTCANDLWLAYCELRASGLELDHECETPECRNPAHLTPVTHAENMRRWRERRHGKALPDFGVELEAVDF